MRFDRDIPIPDRSGSPGNGRPPHYPLAAMAIGDSAMFGPDEVRAIRAALNNHKRKNPGWDYVTRKEGDGLRVWRTA